MQMFYYSIVVSMLIRKLRRATLVCFILFCIIAAVWLWFENDFVEVFSIPLVSNDMLQTLTWPTLQQPTSTQNKTYYVLQDRSPYRCSSYNNINTNRLKNQTISSFYIQTSSCIQRSVQVLILSEHNHSLEFTTSNYSSMPNSQHV